MEGSKKRRGVSQLAVQGKRGRTFWKGNTDKSTRQMDKRSLGGSTGYYAKERKGSAQRSACVELLVQAGGLEEKRRER